MFEPLLAVDPTFMPRWQAFLAEWRDERELPLYLALGELADHLIERLERSDVSDFADVFAVVEAWHLEGDSYVREAATVGLLESIQNQLGGQDRRYRSANGVRAADFERWLFPESKRWWEKLYRFWDGDIRALQEDG
jgi:hypothetical protein